MARSQIAASAPPPLTSNPATTSTPTTRTSTRTHARKSSTSTASVSSPFILIPSAPRSPPSTSRQYVKQVAESKTHALRSIYGERERAPCPFPSQYGGAARCGVTDEDEKDEVLMATCAACASVDNCAVSVDEIASMSYDKGWLRPPTAAIQPSTVINNAIRAHLKRCECAIPPRQPLLNKHILAGSVNESVLGPALHPHAFSGPTGQVRPKGTVWYLTPSGRIKWRDPFDGLEVPNQPPRKPVPKSKGSKDNKEKKEDKEDKEDKEERKGKTKAKAKTLGPFKIRLTVKGSGAQAEEDDRSDVGSSSQGSRSRSGSTPSAIAQPTPLHPMRRLSRRAKDILDSSSESDSSDSEMDVDPGPSRIMKTIKPIRRNPPLPLAATNYPRRSHLPHRTTSSSFADLFSSPALSSIPPYVQHIQSQLSPFPSHSLDNTTWAARQDQDRFISFETSSSSSDDEMREPEWGTTSGILIRGEDGDDHAVWSAEDEEMKVKEATDALKVLFPMSSSPDEEVDVEPKFELNRLDNRPAPSDTSSLAESSSTVTVQAIYNGHLKVPDAGGTMAVSAWTAGSSPAPSPKLRAFVNLVPEISPTQHLSKLRSSLDPSDMNVEGDKQWLDESGELPVRAEDSFSDVDIGSTEGDVPTPERDRQLHTAAWAREAAARIKEEPQDDYPSPLTTEPDDQSALIFYGSRASSTPSSGSSETHPFEVDSENASGRKLDEVVMGPESISVEEVDGWLPAVAEKTPQRGRHNRSRQHPQRGSGNWGCIGVGAMLAKTQSNVRKSNRRRRSSPRFRRLPTPPPTDEPDHERETTEIDDAIGTADLERARVEAEATEEQHRKSCREKSEQQKALLEAYRQRVRETHDVTSAEGLPTVFGSMDLSDLASASLSSGSWASSESTPSALSPMALHSPVAFSLGNDYSAFPLSMDPKDLLSPAIQSQASMPSLDEVIFQADVEAVMPTIEASPPLIAAASTSSAPIPITISPGPIEPDETPTTETTATIVDLPSTLPADVIDSSKSSMPPSSTKAQGTFTKRLCPGVDACVVDNIPVYALVSENKSGKIVVLRRLDTDFVNGSSLLAALGVLPCNHGDYLNAPSPTLLSHHVVPGSVAGATHSIGVPGVWVQLVEAREFAKKLPLGEGTLLSNILREDLFQQFAMLAGIKPDHTAAENFGLPFIARRPASVNSSTLPYSANNSRSAPNLAALSASAPNTNPNKDIHASTTPKGPLIRPAPHTPGDGCPQTKRRRATVIGGFNPLIVSKPGVTTRKDKATMTAAARRATRASANGDTPKPKISK